MTSDVTRVLILMCLARPLCAQVITYDGCVDDRGLAVGSTSDSNVQDIAVAMRAPNGAPLIRYNPQVVAWVHPETRLFFYGHECAHHALGQITLMPSKANEQQADCWSARELTRQKLLSHTNISVVQADIAKLGKEDWAHIAGPERAIRLGNCLKTDTVVDPVEREQVYQDAYDECMEARVERCMDSCQDVYGHSYTECSASFCRIEAPANAQAWEPICKKKARAAVKEWESEQKGEQPE